MCYPTAFGTKVIEDDGSDVFRHRLGDMLGESYVTEENPRTACPHEGLWQMKVHVHARFHLFTRTLIALHALFIIPYLIFTCDNRMVSPSDSQPQDRELESRLRQVAHQKPSRLDYA